MLNLSMRKTRFTIRWIATSLALFFAAELFTVASFAQAPLPQAPPPEAPPGQVQAPPYYPPQELQRLLSPIALYPDPLLAQILTASTFPNDIPDAAQWAD